VKRFITGTDTGVGKTFVTCELTRLARARGQRVFAFKPIETGCNPIAEDQDALCLAAGDWQTGDLRGCYRFAIPAAPSVAATEPIELARIDRAITAGSSQADLTLIEGAGGWRVPISSTLDMGGFAHHIGCPVILVARAELGTINHSLLTAQAIQSDGCELLAIVLSLKPSNDLAFARSNRDEIQARTSAPVLLSTELASLLP
jgi:dethiobiotin synthetase